MANTKRNEEEALIALFKRLRNLIPGIPPTEEVGITPPQFNLLERVANFPGSSMREIAEGLNLTPPTVSVAVRRLEKKGFLLRKPDAQDKRSIRLYLTKEGEALYQRGEVFRRSMAKRLLSGLSAEEKTQLTNLLGRAIHAAETFNKEIQDD